MGHLAQSHVILVFIFPEYDSEYVMQYTWDQLDEAKRDAVNFTEMYPGALYVQVFRVYQDGREENTYQWNNPAAAKLLRQQNNVGLAMPQLSMTSGSAPSAGRSSNTGNAKRTTSRLDARPPSAEQHASPLPGISKVYGGRKSIRTRRGRDK